ncbi:RNA polymerase sigma factor [Bradyrhizobium betae]|uniref:RNA polymerase sigma factor n=1 Tax=Bradyrhizobium betae TaxID=244734 RepID=UPI003D66ED2A
MPGCIKEDPPYPGAPRLTLVSTDRHRSSRGQSDWSKLMACAQDGDRDSYRALLTEIEPYIRSIAIRYLSHSADMEDAVQDVLITVHSIRQTYDPKRPFGPWLVAIANRRIIDRLRRTMRHRSREVELSAEHETSTAAPANLFGDKAPDRTLVSAIDKLPPDQRDAIRMLKLNEMSLKEASLASGRSIAALKVATHRAIKNLRKLLKGEST